MVIAFLMSSALCIAQTDICAPANSKIEGSITQMGGQVTVTPPTPMMALGAEFRAGVSLVVTVQPWSSTDHTRSAIVHVRGELGKEAVISGARVAGTVRVGQMQGRHEPVQLVEATDLKGGHLTVFSAGTVDVAPGMRLQGHVALDGGILEITSTQPVHALGVDLAAGVVRIEQHSTAATISGTLVRPQEMAGVWVDGEVVATIEHGHPSFGHATLARATPLQALGLPTGEAPTGTVVSTLPGTTRLSSSGPITVCGLAVRSSLAQPAVTFETIGRIGGTTMRGMLAGDVDISVGDAVHLTGQVAVDYAPGSCQAVGVEGTLSRLTEVLHMRFAGKTALSITDRAGERIVRGALAQPDVVDGLPLTGTAMVRVTSAGAVHMMDGKLAKPAPFEEWQLPAGTRVQRSVGDWSFTTPHGQSARALAAHRGERVDGVVEGRSDADTTTLTVVTAYTPTGTTLAFHSLAIDHHTGCVLGELTTAQRFGIFHLPASSSATVCAGTVVAAQGIYAVPSLQVGKWFATEAIAGAPGSPPAMNAAPPSTSGPLAGYWLQINSLCQGLSGIPQPPPAQQWIWVDAKGQPASADLNALSTLAAKVGTACPASRCCPP